MLGGPTFLSLEGMWDRFPWREQLPVSGSALGTRARGTQALPCRGGASSAGGMSTCTCRRAHDSQPGPEECKVFQTAWALGMDGSKVHTPGTVTPWCSVLIGSWCRAPAMWEQKGFQKEKNGKKKKPQQPNRKQKNTSILDRTRGEAKKDGRHSPPDTDSGGGCRELRFLKALSCDNGIFREDARSGCWLLAGKRVCVCI